ncbi:MAG: TIGR03943 family putative permease subunit [Actinomycetota bacterium]
MTRWNPTRVAQTIALAAWGGLFWFLILSDRTSLYLSSRTAWVVPVGAIALTIAAIGRLANARTLKPAALPRRTAWAVGFVLLPVVAILALPPAALGSYAASRRSLATGIVTSAPSLEAGGQVTLASVAAAGWSEDARRSLVNRAGSPVTFEGIVALRDGQAANEFMLTRYIISCCVADAISVQVRVVGAPPGKFEEDDWVRVSGSFYPVGQEVVVAATEVEPIPQPDHPYLNV